MSRLPVDADRNNRIDVDRRAAAASEEATQRHEIKDSMSPAHCHIKPHKNLNLRWEHTVSHVRAVRQPGVSVRTVVRHLRLILLEVAVGVRGDLAVDDVRHLHSA